MTSRQITRRTRDGLRRLEALAGAAEGRWLVLPHDGPDPDALVSAVLLGRLLEQAFSQRVTIGYAGVLGRPENIALARVLSARPMQMRRLAANRYRNFALVDSQPGSGNSKLLGDVTPLIVLDHHPIRPASRHLEGLVDVRDDYGATVTIVGEYLLAAGLELTPAEATGIAYAIRSETRDFAREYSSADKRLYDVVLPLVDKRALGKIQNAPLPLAYFATMHRALGGLCQVGRMVATHLGEVEQPDIAAELADLLLRMEGKTWALCTAKYAGRLQVSLRTSNPRAEAGAVIQRLIGSAGSGGGHGQTGGGWLPLDGDRSSEHAHRLLTARLALLLGEDPARLGPVLDGPGQRHWEAAAQHPEPRADAN